MRTSKLTKETAQFLAENGIAEQQEIQSPDIMSKLVRGANSVGFKKFLVCCVMSLTLLRIGMFATSPMLQIPETELPRQEVAAVEVIKEGDLSSLSNPILLDTAFLESAKEVPVLEEHQQTAKDNMEWIDLCLDLISEFTEGYKQINERDYNEKLNRINRYEQISIGSKPNDIDDLSSLLEKENNDVSYTYYER